MRRGLRALVAVAAAGALGACGGATHDNPAVTGPAGAPGPAMTAAGGGAAPSVSQVAVGAVRTPQVAGPAGAPVVNAALLAEGRQLGAGGRACAVATTRADAALVSFRWSCSDRSVATATFAVATGRRLALGDVLAGGYLQYLSSTAAAQLQAGGATAAAASAAASPSPASFALWDLTPDSLEVSLALPSGPVAVGFPIGSLGTYLAPGGPLR